MSRETAVVGRHRLGPSAPAGSTELAAHSTALRRLEAAGVPFAVGGYHALHHYTGVSRETKDLDLFLPPGRVPAALKLLREAGFGNWLTPIDKHWLEQGPRAELHGVPVRMAPIEEMIWIKAFVSHRKRYDGADIMHLIRAGGPSLDWRHLLDRFGAHWELLAALVVLFRFVYPADTDRIPRWVEAELLTRLERRWQEAPPQHGVCRGTLLDRYQYLQDVLTEGIHDPREELAEAQGFSRRLVELDRREALGTLRAGRVRPAPDA